MLSNKIIVNVCVNVSRTSYRQATDRLPTHYQQSADCRPTVGRQVAYISGKTCRPSVGRLSADSRPTVGRQVFWGALLHDYRPSLFNFQQNLLYVLSKITTEVFPMQMHFTKYIFQNSETLFLILWVRLLHNNQVYLS